MQIRNFYSLAKSKTVLFADQSFMVFLCTDNVWLIRQMYSTIQVHPALYEHYIKVLDIDTLKAFKKCIEPIKTNIDRASINRIVNEYPLLSEDDAFTVLFAKANDVDIIIDDPEKAGIFTSYGLHTVRLSDIISSASTTP